MTICSRRFLRGAPRDVSNVQGSLRAARLLLWSKSQTHRSHLQNVTPIYSESAMTTDATILSADVLSEEIRTVLFSDSPDMDNLHTKLERDYPLSSDNAKDLIYQVARSVNTSFFPPLTQLELILTEGCNLACTYCFEKDMLGYKRMPLEIAQSAVDLLFDYSANESDAIHYPFRRGTNPQFSCRPVCNRVRRKEISRT